MASPPFVAAGAIATIPSAGNGSASVATPAGLADGHYVFIFAVMGNGATPAVQTVPAGFSVFAELSNGSFASGYRIWGKRASSEPSTYTITETASGAQGRAFTAAWSGVGTAVTDDIQTNHTRPLTTTPGFPTVTATSAETTLVGFGAEDQTRALTLTAAGGMTLRFESNSGSRTMGLFDEAISGTGSVSGRSFSSSSSGNWNTASILLTAGVGGGGSSIAPISSYYRMMRSA
jgi:hypothetical protein